MLLILCFVIGILWALRSQLPMAQPSADGADVTQVNEEGKNFGGGGQDIVPTHQPLDEAKKQLITAGKFLALGGIGKLFFTPLLWFVSGVVLARARFLFKDAWRSAVIERKPRVVIVDSIMMIVSLLSGWLFVNIVLYGFYRLFNYIALKTEDHSRQQMIDVYAKQPRTVWSLVDGVEVEVPFENLIAGNLIVLRAGDLVPVDGSVVEGTANIDQHILTGESQLVEKISGDTVFASTIVVSGRLVVQSSETGATTMAAQLGAALNATNSYAATVEARGMALADKGTIPSLLFGGAALLLRGTGPGLGALSGDFGASMRVFGPVSVLKHLQSGAERGLYIKDGQSLELLRSVDTVVFDKTGTLTTSEPVVVRTHGWRDHDPARVLGLAAAAEMKLTHPIARAIVKAARDGGVHVPMADENSYEIGSGVRVVLTEGIVQVGSLRYFEREKIDIVDDASIAEKTAYEAGHSVVFVAFDGAMVGAIEMRAQLKPGSEATIRRLQEKGVSIIILSGDHEMPTRSLAQSLGIERYFAGVLPHEKAEVIKTLQAEGRSVCFIGDGINDSIALKTAQVSVSFHGASTIATDAAQVVMIDENLETLLTLFDLSNSLNHNMRASYRISMIGTGVIVVSTIVLGVGFFATVVAANIGRVAGLANAMRNPVNGNGVAVPPKRNAPSSIRQSLTLI